MSGKIRLALIRHEWEQGLPCTHFLVHRLIRLWRESGTEVNEVFGPRVLPEVRHAFMHVWGTVVPAAYPKAGAAYGACINKELHDIRKTRISRQGVRPGDGYEGPVIVKTEANNSGADEKQLFQRYGKKNPVLAWARSWQRPFTGPFSEKLIFGQDEYPVFSTPHDVPAVCWEDSRYFVERFLPEKRGDRYVVRMAFVLGDRQMSFVAESRQPVVKGANIESIYAEATPPEVREFQREIGMDYGKIDYVLHDGRCIVFDVNTTPGSPSSLDQEDEKIAAELAPGLFDVLNR
jgi:hypothetical protein